MRSSEHLEDYHMKKTYNELDIELIRFHGMDIVTGSNDTPEFEDEEE